MNVATDIVHILSSHWHQQCTGYDDVAAHALFPSGEEDMRDLSDWHPVTKKKGRSEVNNKASRRLSLGTAASLLPTVPKEKRSKAPISTLNNSKAQQKHASDTASSSFIGSPNRAKISLGPSISPESRPANASALSGLKAQPQQIPPIAVHPNSSAGLITQPPWIAEGALSLLVALLLCTMPGPAQEGVVAYSIAPSRLSAWLEGLGFTFQVCRGAVEVSHHNPAIFVQD